MIPWRPPLVYLAIAVGATTAIALLCYAIGSTIGLAHWSPGGGRWTTVPQMVLNLVVNVAVLGVFGTFTAIGEEFDWRGYLQPRLDAAGVRGSVFVSFHNSVSQWLFPKFFAGGDNELWLGESGILPVAGYVVLGLAFYAWMRQRGQSWDVLARRALLPATERIGAGIS